MWTPGAQATPSMLRVRYKINPASLEDALTLTLNASDLRGPHKNVRSGLFLLWDAERLISVVPTGLKTGIPLRSHPALKRRATIGRPSGAKRRLCPIGAIDSSPGLQPWGLVPIGVNLNAKNPKVRRSSLFQREGRRDFSDLKIPLSPFSKGGTSGNSALNHLLTKPYQPKLTPMGLVPPSPVVLIVP